jgi:hypothetical protein
MAQVYTNGTSPCAASLGCSSYVSPAKSKALQLLIPLLKWTHISDLIYCPTIAVVKIAILTQYLQILAPNRTVNSLMFFGSWITIVAVIIFYTVMFFAAIFQCSPQKKIWDITITEGHCRLGQGFVSGVIATGVFNIVSDFVILALPSTTVWRLRIGRAKKVGITALFSTGLM